MARRGAARSSDSMSAMNAETDIASPAVTSTTLLQRIDDERRRLLVEQNLQENLGRQRVAPLELGDDEALDRLEVQINACCDRQMRIQERIEILTRRVDEAKAKEDAERIETLFEHAHRARELGEESIRGEYSRLATALAGVLRRLAAIDDLIDDVNGELRKAGHELVPSPNRIRCRTAQRVVCTKRRRVGVGDRDHPMYGKVDVRSYGHGAAIYYDKDTGKRVESFGNFDVAQVTDIPAHMPYPLWKEVAVLPAAQATPSSESGDVNGRPSPPIWRGGDHFPPASHADVAALRAELGDLDGQCR
jgi:hypothetical protein